MDMEMKTGVVYVLYSDKCDDFFIGASTNYKERIKKYKNYARQNKKSSNLCKKMREVGVDNWKVEEIEVNVPLRQLLFRQQYYIDTLSPSLNQRYAIDISGCDYYGNPKKNENEPKKNENEPQ